MEQKIPEGMKEVKGWPVRFRIKQDRDTMNKVTKDTARSIEWIAKNDQTIFHAIDRKYVYYGFPTHELQQKFLQDMSSIIDNVNAFNFKVEAINNEIVLGYEKI